MPYKLITYLSSLRGKIIKPVHKNWHFQKFRYNTAMKLGLFMLILLSPLAWSSPAEEREETRYAILDSAQEFFGYTINNVANDFDSFFATERADDELGRSKIRLRASYRVQERALPIPDTTYRFNLRLPHLEQKFKKIVEDKKPKKNESKSEKIAREKRLIERNKLDTRWIFSGDTSVNVSIRPRAEIRGRIRKSAATGTLIHRFVHEVSLLTNRDGLRQRTTFDTDHTFSPDLLFRFSNRVEWRITEKNFFTAHGPGLFQRLSPNSAMSYSFSAATIVEEGRLFLSGYNLSAGYRKNLYRNMIYWDFQPGLDFPKTWSFRRTPYLFSQIEVVF